MTSVYSSSSPVMTVWAIISVNYWRPPVGVATRRLKESPLIVGKSILNQQAPIDWWLPVLFR